MTIATVSGTPLEYHLVCFDAEGQEREQSGSNVSQNIIQFLSKQPTTDVFIFSHGWLDDIPAAHNRYRKWIGAMSQNLADIEQMREVRPGFKPLLIGLHWPSLPWGDESLGNHSVSYSAQEVSLIEILVKRYSECIANTEPARQALRTIFQSAQENTSPDTLPPEVLEAYQVLNQEAGLNAQGVGAAPGLDYESSDRESIFQDVNNNNFTSYGGSLDRNLILAPLIILSFWKMKDRARQIGEISGFELLKKLQQTTSNDVRFHLMGHSFGCIVVSATLAGLDGRGTLIRPVNSITLAQGALSLWSYCSDIPYAPGRAGYFRSIVADHKVAGSIITTQSENDTAVRNMYPLGERFGQQVHFSARADDFSRFPKYGGLGTFGARGPDLDIVDMQMLPVDGLYQFEAGKIYNLDSSNFICDRTGGGLGGAHKDIVKAEVAHAIWQAAISS